MTRRRSGLLVLAAATMLGLTLAGCTSSRSAIASSTPPASTPSVRSSAAPSPSTSTSSSSAVHPTVRASFSSSSAPRSGANAALRSCAIGSLAVADTGQDVQRGGLAYGTITARNTGTHACTITGYPGVRLLSGGTTAATTLSRAPGRAPRAVTLEPGASASFGFSRRAYGKAAHCDDITGARIYDPDGSGYATTDTMFTECEGIQASGLRPVPLTVGPFEAGADSSLR